MMSQQPGHGATGKPSGPGHGFSAITGGTPAPAADRPRTSDLGRFDWFAAFEDFGLAPEPADGAGNHQGSTGAWWRPAHWRTRDRRPGQPWRLAFWRYDGQGGRWLRGWRLVATATALAVACTLLGGVVGGFVALRNQDTLADRTYSIGPVPPALTSRPASSVAGIAARDTPAVVMIKVNGDQGTGSGFLIQGGYIVTDNHVVTLDGLVPGATLQVYFSSGKSARAVLVGRDPYSDIAVVRAVGLTNLPALTLGNSSSVQVGDPVIAIGSPLGLADTVTSGIVSAVDRPVQPGAGPPGTPQDFFDAIQTDAPINPGNSGGPLVNARGQVIGVDAAIDTLGADPITGTQGGSIGLGFAIPIDQARRVVVQLIRYGHATHSVIGADVNDNYSGNGAQIQGGVVAGGPAAQAGLRAGDVVIGLGDQPIASAYALLDAVRSLAPGTNVPVSFIRHGETRQTNLTLGSASS
jgi:S1-C subfamily serine protease